MDIKRTTWDYAGKAGLALGAVSSAYFAANSLISVGISGVWGSVATFALWGLKFYLCIWLLKKFMKIFVKYNPEAGNPDTLRFGILTSLLSSLVYSAFYLAWVTFIQPDIFIDALQEVAASMPADAVSQMQDMMDRMPKLTFFANLIYCFIFGTVLSLILSRDIPPVNPFEGEEENDIQ